MYYNIIINRIAISETKLNNTISNTVHISNKTQRCKYFYIIKTQAT